MKDSVTILLVEDDASILDGMGDLLQIFDIGYDVQVLKASDGMAGLAMMEEKTPDLIISDIMMPRLNGFEFLSEVRANPSWVHIPFIFLTAKGKKQDIREGRRSGAELYITKPFVSAELLELVKSQLDRTFQLQRARQRKLGALKRNILQLLNHEFRTPLTYVTAYYDMLADSLTSVEDPGNLQEYLRGIQVGCIRLTNLVEDLITIMEIRTGKAAARVKRNAHPIADLGSLLRQRADAVKGRADQAGISLEYDISSELPAVFGDPGALSDAIDRLLDNALKFTRARQEGPKRVRISARSSGDTVRLSIEDTGIGFPAHVQRQLFDLFFQYNREQLEQQGSGSGLAIAKGLIELHSGLIEVNSEVDGGSRFTIVLPHNGQQVQLGGSSDRRPRATILIVEDDRHLLEGLKELMEMAECPYLLKIVTAPNGQEGLRVLARHQPDLIISDIMMPIMGGYDFLEHVRANAAWVQIPFIFLTAKGEHEDIHRGRRSGAEEYITKPYDIDELMDLTVTQLDRYFQRQGAVSQSFEQLKRSILGMLQPDFRGPLDLVTSYSEKLATDLQKAQTDEDMVSSLEVIQASSARLTRLVEDFIAMAEYKTGEAQAAFRMRAEPVKNVSMLLYEAAYARQYDDAYADVEFRFELEHELPPVLCDREQLADAINRLLNIILELRSREDETIIQLETGGDSQDVSLSLHCVGVHFPEEWVGAIQDFFAESEESILELAGIGPTLTVIKSAVQLHEGQITLEREGNDVFRITLRLPTHQHETASMPA